MSSLESRCEADDTTISRTWPGECERIGRPPLTLCMKGELRDAGNQGEILVVMMYRVSIQKNALDGNGVVKRKRFGISGGIALLQRCHPQPEQRGVWAGLWRGSSSLANRPRTPSPPAKAYLIQTEVYGEDMTMHPLPLYSNQISERNTLLTWGFSGNASRLTRQWASQFR